MVTDDEEFCIASMKVILDKAKIDAVNQVDYCITGLEALNQLQIAHGFGLAYKIIFTDFNMPEMDGIEATIKMRKFLADLGIPRKKQPVIIGITGHV